MIHNFFFEIQRITKKRWFDEDIQQLSQVITKKTTQSDSNLIKSYADNKKKLLTQEHKHKKNFMALIFDKTLV